jgi:DNA end-binding protein Ku
MARKSKNDDSSSDEEKSESFASSGRPIWTGAISLGMVTIPVRLLLAVREKTIHFRSLHDQDLTPIKQKMFCPADGKEVHREHIVKGYEVEKDHFVVVRQEELDAAAPKSSKAIEIQDFVELGEIDPVFFDRAYYVAPKPEGVKPYRLLFEAMSSEKKVGIAKFVMHNKEYLAALRPVDKPGTDEDVLMLETMHFGDEVVPAASISDLKAGGRAKVDERELRVARQLIDALSTKFDPSKYHDEYREKVMELIDQKAAGKKVVTRQEPPPVSTRGSNLMAALEASLAKNRAATGHVSAPRPPSGRRRRSA